MSAQTGYEDGAGVDSMDIAEWLQGLRLERVRRGNGQAYIAATVAAEFIRGEIQPNRAARRVGAHPSDGAAPKARCDLPHG